MKKFLYLVMFIFFVACTLNRDFHQVKKEHIRHNRNFPELKPIPIKGKAVYKMDYCGAAKPPNNWLATQPFLKLKKTTLIFRKDSDPDIDITVKTDSSGFFSVSLYEGVWRYYLTENFKDSNAKNESSIPAACDEFYNVPYGSFEITRDLDADTVFFKDLSFYRTIDLIQNSTEMDSILFYLPCNPCNVSTKP